MIRRPTRSAALLAASAALTAGACSAADKDAAEDPGPAWVFVKAAVHVHSVHSHDACDGEPRVDGRPNAPCAQDLRDGVCANRYDHIFLTDHDSEMATEPWSELLEPYFRDGDEWIGGEARFGLAMQCPGGHVTRLYPGAENDLMPIGLDRHVGQDLAIGSDELHRLYDKDGADSVAAFKAVGGVVFVNHAEQHTTEEIAAYDIDGIEIYNIHATLQALLEGRGGVGDISEFLKLGDDAAPADLLFLALFTDNVEDLTHWATLSHTRRLSGVAAHDVHRNALPGPMADGERMDSYRRILSWYSNRVAVRGEDAGSREAVREALKLGRSYMSGDVVADTAGFDALVRSDNDDEPPPLRMGDEAPWTPGMAVHVAMPPVPDGAEVEVALVEMRADGTWGDLSTSDAAAAELALPLPSAGVYRIDVRLTPRHLAARLHGAAHLADKPFVWVRTNPFHLR